MIAWAEFGGMPASVRTYRVLLTVAVMVVMGVLVFVKQHLLDQELLSLLRSSRHNLDEICRLKDELENKEHSLRWHSLELQRKNLELQEISFTDVLTGVWNRRYLEEILTAEAGQVLRNYQRARGSEIRKMDHRDLVFIMVDVDFFKQVNDSRASRGRSPAAIGRAATLDGGSQVRCAGALGRRRISDHEPLDRSLWHARVLQPRARGHGCRTI